MVRLARRSGGEGRAERGGEVKKISSVNIEYRRLARALQKLLIANGEMMAALVCIESKLCRGLFTEARKIARTSIRKELQRRAGKG